ncbi:hypothetical protein COO60DRAFT_1516925 [Scenedesmus sp. NREL 46B-D3]|nr:hypothetical protein COO60DRAFT_1516925 [Scenedesmus sp. NREL 46B-D3]
MRTTRAAAQAHLTPLPVCGQRSTHTPLPRLQLLSAAMAAVPVQCGSGRSSPRSARSQPQQPGKQAAPATGSCGTTTARPRHRRTAAAPAWCAARCLGRCHARPASCCLLAQLLRGVARGCRLRLWMAWCSCPRPAMSMVTTTTSRWWRT